MVHEWCQHLHTSITGRTGGARLSRSLCLYACMVSSGSASVGYDASSVDVPGYDLDHGASVDTVEECSRLCDANPRCAGFTVPGCQLKSSLSPQRVSTIYKLFSKSRTNTSAAGMQRAFVSGSEAGQWAAGQQQTTLSVDSHRGASGAPSQSPPQFGRAQFE